MFSKTDSIKILYIDEGDELLARGFDDLVDAVYELLLEGIQIIMGFASAA
jgi:superfamily II DNA/RNA helicase